MFGIEVTNAQTAVLESGRCVGSEYKNSFHVLINTGYGLPQPARGERSLMGVLVKAFVNRLPADLQASEHLDQK